MENMKMMKSLICPSDFLNAFKHSNADIKTFNKINWNDFINGVAEDIDGYYEKEWKETKKLINKTYNEQEKRLLAYCMGLVLIDLLYNNEKDENGFRNLLHSIMDILDCFKLTDEPMDEYPKSNKNGYLCISTDTIADYLIEHKHLYEDEDEETNNE